MSAAWPDVEEPCNSVASFLAGSKASMQSRTGCGSPQQLSGQVSDLKIELARRDAEVEYLEGQLAEAVAANRPRLRLQADHSSQVCIVHLC